MTFLDIKKIALNSGRQKSTFAVLVVVKSPAYIFHVVVFFKFLRKFSHCKCLDNTVIQ